MGTFWMMQTWPSTGERNFAVDIPQTYLVEGTNTLTVECPRDGGITIDQVLVNWFEIDYYHTYTAENNLLVFGGDQPGSWEFQVGGFSSSTIDVFDITDPLAPARIVGGSVTPRWVVLPAQLRAAGERGAPLPGALTLALARTRGYHSECPFHPEEPCQCGGLHHHQPSRFPECNPASGDLSRCSGIAG